jgi:hypothetical protein
MILPSRDPSSVEDIRELPMTGPWRSKSGGLLSVPFTLPYAQAMNIFDYDPAELARIPRDIRGLRMFVLEEMPAGGVGGGEFHRLRIEIAFTMKGKVRWMCEDVYGGRKEFCPSRDCSLYFPPFIMHSVESLEAGSALVIIANTLYDADDARTHDTYPAAAFRELQEHYRSVRARSPDLVR